MHRPILTALIATLLPALAVAAPPSPSRAVDTMLDALGGREAFTGLGVVRLDIREEETAADGTIRKGAATLYVHSSDLDNLRLEFPPQVVLASTGRGAWATVNGEVDTRPQSEVMAQKSLNQRTFPTLLPYSLLMEGVDVEAVSEAVLDGTPAWRLTVDFPEQFFMAPSMQTDWSAYVDRSSGEFLAAEYLPHSGMQATRDEGIRYRVLKWEEVDGVRLPARILLDGIDPMGNPTGHTAVHSVSSTVVGEWDPSLFLHPDRLKAIEEGDLSGLYE